MSTMMTRITQLEAKVAYQAKEMAEKVGILLQAVVSYLSSCSMIGLGMYKGCLISCEESLVLKKLR